MGPDGGRRCMWRTGWVSKAWSKNSGRLERQKEGFLGDHHPPPICQTGLLVPFYCTHDIVIIRANICCHWNFNTDYVALNLICLVFLEYFTSETQLKLRRRCKNPKPNGSRALSWRTRLPQSHQTGSKCLASTFHLCLGLILIWLLWQLWLL